MTKVNNPRWPHHVKILRERIDNDGNPILDDEMNPILDIVFESECGDRSDNKDTSWQGEVITADYKLSLPKHSVIIHRNDYVEFTNGINGELIKGQVVKAKVNNLGANIWFNYSSN